MLKFLKSLLKQKEEAVKEDVSIEKLPSWLNAKKEKLLSNINSEIKTVNEKLRQEKEKTDSDLETLKNAQLHNPNIPLRAKQFMEGNREAYMKKIKSFSDAIRIPAGHKEITAYCESFHSQLEILGRSTLKPYHVLQEFFSNESRDLAINIKSFEKIIRELESAINKSKIGDIEKIEQALIHLINSIKKKHELEAEIRQKQEELKDTEKEKHETEARIRHFEQSSEYKEFNQLKAEKEVLLAKIREHSSILTHNFAAIEASLKKFSRMSMDEDLVNSYLENPVNALLEDKELKILELLQSLEKNIFSNSIELKDKKREKTLSTIKELNKEFLENFLEKYSELSKKLEHIERSLYSNESENMHKNLNHKLREINENLERTSKRKQTDKEELSKISIEEMKKNLEKEIKSSFGAELIIQDV